MRTAFDSLSEGVVVIDKQDNIVLANSSFRVLHPEGAADLTGKKISDLDWLVSAVGSRADNWPWQRAMRGKTAVTGETITISRDGDAPVKLTVNSAPIMDERKEVRGCLITLDDLSLIEHMNQQLLDMVAQLEVAKSHIEERNRELKYMGDHDQLSGALTRRAFLERAQQQFSIGTGQRAEGSCVIVDIDHFKSINDRYGHLVGDQAIQRVAAILRENVGAQDLVCRYGGEEFCVLVVGTRPPRTGSGGEIPPCHRDNMRSRRGLRRGRAHYRELRNVLARIRCYYVDRADQAGRPGALSCEGLRAQPRVHLR